MGRLAFFNLATLFDAQGTLKPLSDLPAEARSALASVEVVRRKLTAGDGAPTWVHKVKIGDKLKALEMLAKHFRLRGEPVAVNGVDWEKLAARLASARQRKVEEPSRPVSAGQRGPVARSRHAAAGESPTLVSPPCRGFIHEKPKKSAVTSRWLSRWQAQRVDCSFAAGGVTLPSVCCSSVPPDTEF